MYLHTYIHINVNRRGPSCRWKWMAMSFVTASLASASFQAKVSTVVAAPNLPNNIIPTNIA